MHAMRAFGGGCRYYTMIDGVQEGKDWSTAEKYYRQAVEVFPEGAELTRLEHWEDAWSRALLVVVCRCLRCLYKCI